MYQLDEAAPRIVDYGRLDPAAELEYSGQSHSAGDLTVAIGRPPTSDSRHHGEAGFAARGNSGQQKGHREANPGGP